VPLRSELLDGLYTVVWGAVADASGAHGEGGFDFGLRAGASLPTLRVDRPSASAGDTISIFGTGFKVGGSVVVSASVDHELVDALRADSRGSIEARIRLPSSLPWGTQRITAADGDGASAIATVQIASSVAPPIRARVVPTSHAQSVELAINVVNRSGYDLRLAEVRLGVPAGAIFARADSGGRPSGLREVGWDGLRLAPGERLTMTATFDTRGLPDPTEVSSAATIRYVHPFEDTADNASLPRFRGSITTDPGVIRVGGLD
jgi:hypothetical protein